MSLPSVDELLLELEGHEEQLAGLMQERYAMTRDEANQQVKSFLARFKS